MNNNKNIYVTIAESIVDFSNHKLNRLELYEIICNCIVKSDNKDKECISENKTIGLTPYQMSKNWLIKK